MDLSKIFKEDDVADVSDKILSKLLRKNEEIKQLLKTTLWQIKQKNIKRC